VEHCQLLVLSLATHSDEITKLASLDDTCRLIINTINYIFRAVVW